ncbi:MAG: ATP-binding protein, partial [Desulfomonilaceae bacterium]
AKRVAVSIETNLEDCYANVNREQVTGVTIELIKNAMESFKQSGVVTVGTGMKEGESIIFVRDSGTGISKSNLVKIFDPFWTTKGPRKSGLGLARALGTVKQNGGDIDVESLEGIGSHFAVRFPAVKSPGLENQRSNYKDDAKPLTILLIDEEEKVTESLSAGLTSEGNMVYTASTVEKGFQVLETVRVDVIVSDEDFQGTSGWTFGRKLKSLYSALNRQKPPLILLTAWGVGEVTNERMSSTGVDRVLAKPISIEKLMQNIHEILTR